MRIIGLTGGSGAGKTTASQQFARLGAYVIDADQVARTVVQPGRPALAELAAAFGTDILLPDGTLDRKGLAARAFASPEGTALLNRVTHKYITQEIAALLAASDAEVAVIDAAALIESGLAARCDIVVSVLAQQDVRLRRIMERDGLTREQAQLRIDAQKSDQFYIDNSNHVLYNNKEIDIEQIRKIMRDVRGM